MEFLLLFQTNIPNEELFTTTSLTTLVGLTGMVYVASNLSQVLFNFNPKWLAWVIAEILSMLGVYTAFEDPEFVNYVVGFFNGILVYFSAGGVTSAGDTQTGRGLVEPESVSETSTTRKFTTSWW